jgi:hypothetical protein
MNLRWLWFDHIPPEHRVSCWSRAWRGASLLGIALAVCTVIGALWNESYALAGFFCLSVVIFWCNYVGVVRATRILDRRHAREAARRKREREMTLDRTVRSNLD